MQDFPSASYISKFMTRAQEQDKRKFSDPVQEEHYRER